MARPSQRHHFRLLGPRPHVPLHHRLHGVGGHHPADPSAPQDVHGLPAGRAQRPDLRLHLEHRRRLRPPARARCRPPLRPGELRAVRRHPAVHPAHPGADLCLPAGRLAIAAIGGHYFPGQRPKTDIYS